jgi:hypothetical protein
MVKVVEGPDPPVPISSFNAQPRVSVDPGSLRTLGLHDIGEIEQISKKGEGLNQSPTSPCYNVLNIRN